MPPPAPPINPAPPGGARKEARQKQAAVAKSEEGSQTEGGSEQGQVDTAGGPPGAPGAAMTRRDRVKPGPSITTLARHQQPSAWSQGALYGGGIGLAAIVLALGFTTLRPGPRRRRPELPAPAYNRTQNRGRR